MTSRLYRRIFPGTVLAKQAEDLLTTTKGGQRLATAVGGPVAGFRAELTIIDDPGAMIVVMHRLAPDDFTATLLEKGGWFHVSLPRIAVQEIPYTDRFDRDFWIRKPGDLLSPCWTTPQAVESRRKTWSERSIAAGTSPNTCSRMSAR
jgi:hypothetical protein